MPTTKPKSLDWKSHFCVDCFNEFRLICTHYFSTERSQCGVFSYEEKVHIRLWPTEYRLNFWCFMQIIRLLSSLRLGIHFISFFSFLSFRCYGFSLLSLLLLLFSRSSGWLIKKTSQPRSFGYRIYSNVCRKKDSHTHTQRETWTTKSIPNRTHKYIHQHKTQDNLLTEKNNNNGHNSSSTDSVQYTKWNILAIDACIF